MKLSKLNQKRIKKLNEYFDKANEALDNILEITWNQKNEECWDGDFRIDDKEFNILIKRIIFEDIKDGDCVYITKFGLKEKGKINYKKLFDDNTYRSLSTLATVRQSLKDFISEQKPNVLTFVSSDLNETRIKLYQIFCDEIIDKNKKYFQSYNVYRNIPIFIICDTRFNILKITNFYIKIYKSYKLFYNL